MKPPDIKLEASANEEIRLDGINIQMGSEAHAGQAQFQFYWKCLKKTERNYGAVITLVDSRGNTFYEYKHYLCYRLNPTNEWNNGDIVVENFWFVMPSNVPQGAIEVRMGFLDMDKMEVCSFSSKLEGKIDSFGRIKLETFEPY